MDVKQSNNACSVTIFRQTQYKPWGEVRYQAGTTSTSYTYTGQYSNTADFGLMFYNARWYDPALGRFAQADSIVPGGVQGDDRYAYVNNNPVNGTDPTGHMTVEDQGGSAYTALPLASDEDSDDDVVSSLEDDGKGPGLNSPTQSSDDCLLGDEGQLSCYVDFSASDTRNIYKSLDNFSYNLGLLRIISAAIFGFVVGSISPVSGVIVAIIVYLAFENEVKDINALRDTFIVNEDTSVLFERSSSNDPIYINNRNTPIDGYLATSIINRIINAVASRPED